MRKCPVDYRTVTLWMKNFFSCGKHVNDQARSGQSKTLDFEVVFQTIETNPTSSDQASLFSHMSSSPSQPQLDNGIVVREFVLQSRYYVPFRTNNLGKGMNPFIIPATG